MGSPFDLPYSVELWDDADSHVEELIALTGDYRVARAAFDEAVKLQTGEIVTCDIRHYSGLVQPPPIDLALHSIAAVDDAEVLRFRAGRGKH